MSLALQEGRRHTEILHFQGNEMSLDSTLGPPSLVVWSWKLSEAFISHVLKEHIDNIYLSLSLLGWNGLICVKFVAQLCVIQ